MSVGFSVTIDGEKITIKAGDNIDQIKAKFKGNEGTIFDNIDKNKNGTIDENELETLKANLQNQKYEVELAEDGKTPKKAFNSAIQNMKNRYDKTSLEGYFKADDENLHTIQKGDTLYGIAKQSLKDEGLPTDIRSINNRIAQIANINGINDVNNVRIGTKIKIKLTDEGIQKVKDTNNNSEKAFSEIYSDSKGKTSNIGGNANANASKSENIKESPSNIETLVTGKTSTINVSENGLNMGAGMPVDAEGNELKDSSGKRNFKDPKFKEGGCIMKYTNGDKIKYQSTYPENESKLTNGVKISADTIDEVKQKKKDFETEIAKIKSAPESETQEAKKERVNANIEAFKEMLRITDGNIQVIKNIAKKLLDDNYVDRTSDEYKAFVQDLLLTKNAEVVGALLAYDDNDNDNDNNYYYNTVIENDKTATEYLRGMFQEIRAKEKAGEKLTPEEIALKNVLKIVVRYNGFIIKAETENGIHEKEMSYDNNGAPFYSALIENIWCYAHDDKLLDEFITKLKAADTNEKKTALFKEYINTTDKELAKCLARHVKNLNATNEDIIALVNANGVEVINILPLIDENSDDITYSKAVVDAVVARAKEIYTTDKGNLENAVYLENIISWIDKSDMSDEDQTKALNEIAETYIDVSTDADGNKTYTFNPSRRPTYEEMLGLTSLNGQYNEALVKYTKPEDMGKGQYNESIEDALINEEIVPHYTEMVDKMNTPEEVIDFIDNKVVLYKNGNLPYNKILEKFPENAVIKQRILKYVDRFSIISDANRLALVKDYMKVDGDNITFDQSKLPKGIDKTNIIKALPKVCNDGDAQKYFEATLKAYGKDELDAIVKLKNRNPESVKKHIGALVKEHSNNYEFIGKVLNLEDKDLIPYDTIRSIDAKQTKWGPGLKQLVFEKAYINKFQRKDWGNALNEAVNKGLITKINDKYYTINGTDWMYDVSIHFKGSDNKAGTDDDIMSPRKFSKTGYKNGKAMYNELKDAGSGDIAKMLRSSKEEGYENFVTPDNVVGIIHGFNDKSPNEGLMEYIASENVFSAGKKPGKALCNRIPKALMRKAAKMGLTDTEAYKNLANFFGAQDNPNDESFNFTKNDELRIRYSIENAKKLDGLINALVHEMLAKL